VAFSAAEQPRLVVSTPQWTREFPVEREVLTIGRDPGNDIVIDDPVVSARHAQLRRSDARFEIVDLNSTNGLFFQGQKIARRSLADGDVLQIWQTVTLQFKAGPGSLAAIPEPPQATRHLDLRGHDTLTIGRDQGNDTVLDHPLVSRFHARLTRRGATYMIEDLGSTNGTFVNGQRITAPQRLNEGDTIRIGPYRLVFSVQAIQQFDDAGNFRLDALHLNKVVGKGINILQDISLSIYPCEFVALVGVSGAGKSTLLDALSGFRPATGGVVLLNGDELYRNFDAYRMIMGYVPQDDIIHRDLTVYKALDYAAQLRLPADTTPAERQERIHAVLEELGLTERRDTLVKRLSGGQRKRVSIGVELLSKPALFFLDEPTSGLDPGTEARMMRLMRGLADQGRTIVLITHATQNVMLCDKVIFLAAGGHLAYYGPPEEALKYFQVEEFTAIYDRLEMERSPEEWDRMYRSSPYFKAHVVDRLREQLDRGRAQAQRDPVRQAPGAAVKKVSAFKQFGILTRRALDIMAKDVRNLAVLLLQAPIIAFFLTLIFDRKIFDPTPRAGLDVPPVGDARMAMQLTFFLAVVSIWFGTNNSAKEIVKEAAIYKRERTVNLKILPYILSKVGVLFFVGVIQTILLLGIVAWGIDLPDKGVEMYAQLFATLLLTTTAGLTFGLLISALVSSEDMATSLVPIALIPQLIFAGSIVAFNKMNTLSQIIANLSVSKWAFEVLGTILDLNFLFDQHRMRFLKDDYETVFDVSIRAHWGVLGLFILVFLVATYIVQRRKDAL
jgi:ABC-type multidrug transport system ATPase subunit